MQRPPRMEPRAEDPSWQHYADTLLHFEDGPVIDLRQPVRSEQRAALRALGFDTAFAVITAYHPAGRRAARLQNERRHAALHAELRLRDPYCRVVTGASPDGAHREPGVGARLPLAAARAIARRYEQSAFFWYDGASFSIHGARVATPPIALPPHEPQPESSGTGVPAHGDRPRGGAAADAIVVLGGTLAADGTPEPWVAARVARGVEAYAQGVAPRVVFTGSTGLFGPPVPPVTEAAAMARYARALGLPADAILLEERARDTLGNAYFVRRDILDPHGWRTVRVVTSDFHLSRAAWVFRKVLGAGYDFAFTSAFSGFSPAQLIARALDECRISIFLNEWLATLVDGDEISIESLMRHHHPAYGDAPTLSREELERRLAEIARINRIEGTEYWLAAGSGGEANAH